MRRFCLCLFSLGVVAGATVASACSTTVAPEPAPVGSVVDAGTLDAQPNDTAAPEKGGVRVTVSGEDYATLGFDFTPGSATANGDPPAFVEGWQVRFSHVIVTVGNVRLNADPELDPKAYDKVGPVVESDPSAYAVDLVVGGSVVGKSGSPNEKTVAITTFPGKKLDPKKAYAFSYDTVAASANAKLVNLDAGGKDLYAEAIAKGYAMLYVGMATYKAAPPAAGSVFAKMPSKVAFRLGFKNPTSYVNCRNTDLKKVSGSYPRGIRTTPEDTTTVQITFHTDHTFWNRVDVDGTPLFFDALAANASTFGTSGDGLVTTEDLENVDIGDVRTRTGEVLPQRSAVADHKTSGAQVTYDANGPFAS